MIIKINSQNAETYSQFLSDAYQYLERLEWRNAYQALLVKEANDKVKIIDDVDIDHFHSVREDKTFFTREQFKKYEYVKTRSGEETLNYPQSVYIIYDEDRNDEYAFTTIEQYFNYIETIKDSERARYFLLSLPLDEGRWTIDANTRQITIPDNFSSTVVQKDNLAEMIVFKMGRFVDNIDLANVEHIFVQWSAPGTDGTVRNQATEIILREIIDGDLVFGWPITEEVTRYAGTVYFSVAFFSMDSNNKNQVGLRLNTMPQSIEVKPVRQPELNYNSNDIVRPNGQFLDAIKNNQYPGQGVKAPITPDFQDSAAKDLVNNDPMERDLLTFEAQAVVPDNGNITYTWLFTPSDSEKVYDCAGGTYNCKPEEDILISDYNRLEADSQSSFEPLATNQYTMIADEDKNITLTDNTEKTYKKNDIINQEVYDKLPDTAVDYFKPLSTNRYKMIEDEETAVAYKPFGSIYKAYRRLLEDETLKSQDVHFINSESDALKTVSYKENDIISNEKYLTMLELIVTEDHKNSFIDSMEEILPTTLDGKKTYKCKADITVTIQEYEDIIYIRTATDSYVRYAGTDDQANKQKYERYTVFEVPADTATEKYNIVGSYQVKAVNNKPGRDSETKLLIRQVSRPAFSTPCEVKGPSEVKFAQDLTYTNFISYHKIYRERDTISAEEYNRILGLIEKDTDKQIFQNNMQQTESGNYQCNEYTAVYIREVTLDPILTSSADDITYQWQSSSTETGTFTDMRDKTNKALTVSEPGWYKCKILAQKNRHTNTGETIVCRSVLPPRPVTLNIDTTNTSELTGTGWGMYELDYAPDATVSLAVTPQVLINGVDEKSNKLWSDDIIYAWTKQLAPDGVIYPVSAEDLITPPDNFDEKQPAKITVKIPKPASELESSPVYIYRCTATNAIKRNAIDQEVSEVSNTIAFKVG